jgi:hypothetical protein
LDRCQKERDKKQNHNIRNKYGFNEEMFASFFDKIDKKYEPFSLYDQAFCHQTFFAI